MTERWFKMYSKIVESEVFCDNNALRVFIWILASVDYETGTMRFGRFWAAELLGINPNTLKDVLKRLSQKYKIITITSTNRFSTISVLNWAKYQQGNDLTPPSTPTKHQQNTTNQEIIDKKKSNTNVLPKEKEKNTLNEKLQPLTSVRLWEIAMKYNVPLDFVQAKHDAVLLSIADGNKYKTRNVNLAVQKWTLMGIQKNQVETLDELGRMELEEQHPDRVAHRRKVAEFLNSIN